MLRFRGRIPQIAQPYERRAMMARKKYNRLLILNIMLNRIVLFLLVIPKLLVHVAGQGGPALREFTDELTSELYLNPNDCSSAWGVSMLFDLLRPGTDSATALEQICSVIGLCGDNNTELLWEGTVERLKTQYDGSCGSPEEEDCTLYFAAGYRPLLHIANSVWIDDVAELSEPYEEVVGEFLEQIDFSQSSAGDMVNGWVNQSTLGLIDSIIERGAIPYDLIAVNTIYLNAGWQTFFRKEMTSLEIFHVNESTTIEAHFMHLALEPWLGFQYSHNALDGYQVLKLHFIETNSLSMIFVLPLLDESGTWKQEEDTKMLRSLPSNYIKAVLGNLEWENKLAIAIPKFKYESEYENIHTALMSLGLKAPFGSVFCGMLIDSPCLAIEKIIQKTSIDVNEKGVIAAAATSAMLAGAGPPPETVPPLFIANRPFKFFIYDDQEDVFLFEGFVSTPNIPEGSSAPFSGSHNDQGFWTQNFYLDFAPVQPMKPVANMTQKPTEPPTETEPTDNVTTDRSWSMHSSTKILWVWSTMVAAISQMFAKVAF